MKVLTAVLPLLLAARAFAGDVATQERRRMSKPRLSIAT